MGTDEILRAAQFAPFAALNREKKAADRIFGMLPDEQKNEMHKLFAEFEAGETPEAKFARVMDNFQHILLNDSNNG